MQCNMFDLIADRDVPVPRFDKGSTVYIVEIDTVQTATVGHNWICRQENHPAYCGYDIRFQSGGGGVIWDYLIGETVFTDKESAIRMAASVKAVKVFPLEIGLTDIESYAYTAHKQLTATVAKHGDKGLYEHDYMCYHFLRQYANKRDRDKAYRDNLAKMIEETERNNGCKLEPPALEDALYKVTKSTTYASIGYAMHNGWTGAHSAGGE